jgi:aconitate hydratase
LTKEPLGEDKLGKPVFLADIWPSPAEISDAVTQVNSEMFRKQYADVFSGDATWQNLPIPKSKTYTWNEKSTYVQQPPFFADLTMELPKITDIHQARLLVLLGDSVTTDHISPAGSIQVDSPAGKYLLAHGVQQKDFNSYGARRGNHEVMMRGTFANIRIRNEMVPGVEGGFTKLLPSGEVLPIYDAAMKYIEQNIPLIVVAGKEYGSGSSRDWAAKGAKLLGVKAVIAESFERIHRSNLIGMGILPFEFQAEETRKTLKLDGTEIFDITGLEAGIKPRMEVTAKIHRADGSSQNVTLLCRIDTHNEVEYYRNGGILQYMIRNMVK